jgi:hypothetical protein
MAKHAISVTLERENWMWLKGRSRVVGARGISEILDQLVTEARGRVPGVERRSVVGTIDIDEADPLLVRADDAVREIYRASLARPIAVKEHRASYGPGRTRPDRKRAPRRRG